MTTEQFQALIAVLEEIAGELKQLNGTVQWIVEEGLGTYDKY